MWNKIKNIVMLITLGAILAGCTRIEPGYVGIKVNQAGSDKGVEDYPMLTGWIFYFPMTTRIYEYPTFQQNVVWSATGNEKVSSGDESISFNCKGGAAITADVSMSGKFKTERVPSVFVKFRTDPERIVHGYLRNEVRDALGRIASTYDPMDIIGEKRAEFLDAIKKEVESRVGDWWVIDYITFANKLRMDQRIETSINNIIEQKQQTAASLLKVKQTQAEADQKVAAAEGEARSKIAIAKGDSEAVLIKAKTQAEANLLLSQSLTPVLVQYETVQKWSGNLPVYTGGPAPFLSIDPTTDRKK